MASSHCTVVRRAFERDYSKHTGGRDPEVPESGHVVLLVESAS